MVVIMNGTIRYTIRPYDTLYMLAQVFNTTVESLMELNPGIDPRNLQVGQVITIKPGFQYYPPYPINNNMMNDNMMNNNMIYNNMMGNNMMNNRMMNNRMMNNRMPGSDMMKNRMNNRGMNNSMMNEYYEMLFDLTEYMRMLWQQHIFWTRMVILSIIHDLPELESATQRLLRNAADFAGALQPFYGEATARAFENLFRDHITIAAEYVNAANAGDTQQINTIWERWVDNANRIADLMGNINPNWTAEDWSAMLVEHLELLANNVNDLIEQNYQAAVDGFDDIEMQAMEMADMMAEGIALQFAG